MLSFLKISLLGWPFEVTAVIDVGINICIAEMHTNCAAAKYFNTEPLTCNVIWEFSGGFYIVVHQQQKRSEKQANTIFPYSVSLFSCC